MRFNYIFEFDIALNEDELSYMKEIVQRSDMNWYEFLGCSMVNRVNGVVYSTKPLNYGGNLIDDFKIVFKDGKVVDFEAKVGQDILKDLLDIDEGAKYLGEVALVPHSSPISQANIVFFNTLFDENASCHLAFGKAYPTCIDGGEKMTDEELEKSGVNNSLTHEDFMIGSEDLSIIGETLSGETIQIFKNGEWVI